MEQSSIAELEVHFWGGRKVVIRKYSSGGGQVVVSSVPQTLAPAAASSPQSVPAEPQVQVEPKAEQPAAEGVDEERLHKITAPMVGTFYRRPSPDSRPYVEVGDHVEKGQVVCLIEAMKLFNEVKSDVSGVVRKILVEDASPVEFGQVLFLIEPD